MHAYAVVKGKELTMKWYYNFIKRWPELHAVKPSSLSELRAKSASPACIKKYFGERSGVTTGAILFLEVTICGGFPPPVFMFFSSTLLMRWGLSHKSYFVRIFLSSSKYFLILAGEADFSRSLDQLEGFTVRLFFRFFPFREEHTNSMITKP
jgi:hypothetical protein